MTIKFIYQCPKCFHNYIEQRVQGEPPIFTRCNNCREEDYIEINQEILSNNVERYIPEE